MSSKISPGISLQGMMLKLKLQYFGHLMVKPQVKGHSPFGFSLAPSGQDSMSF